MTPAPYTGRKIADTVEQQHLVPPRGAASAPSIAAARAAADPIVRLRRVLRPPGRARGASTSPPSLPRLLGRAAPRARPLLAPCVLPATQNGTLPAARATEIRRELRRPSGARA